MDLHQNVYIYIYIYTYIGLALSPPYRLRVDSFVENALD